MITSSDRSGTTLVELAVVLILVGILLGVAGPSLRRGLDRYAVRAARTRLAGALAYTRALAIARGGATLVLEPAPPRYRIRLDGDGRVVRVVNMGREHGVAVDAGRGRRDPVTFRYDALGIGRSVGRTLRIRRGAVEATLMVSPYGRVR